MPSRNTLRTDAPDCYYHAYARGASKANIFIESADKDYFLYLFTRHLCLKPSISKQGYVYSHLRGKIELLTFCLMDNHFHLLLYQLDAGALSSLMRSVMTAYSTYFNRKYRRTGSPFESRFKAALISNHGHLAHVSRYIHLNPRGWRRFPYSSLHFIDRAEEPEWLQTDRLLGDYKSRGEYVDFVSDYEDNKKMWDEIKADLANL